MCYIPLSFINSYLLPIRKELFKQENSFSDELNLKRQKESISKKLLFITKKLINRFSHDEVNFSQESLTVAQIVVSNATNRTKMKKNKKLVRRHRKCLKTPLLIYSSLKI